MQSVSCMLCRVFTRTILLPTLMWINVIFCSPLHKQNTNIVIRLRAELMFLFRIFPKGGQVVWIDPKAYFLFKKSFLFTKKNYLKHVKQTFLNYFPKVYISRGKGGSPGWRKKYIFVQAYFILFTMIFHCQKHSQTHCSPAKHNALDKTINLLYTRTNKQMNGNPYV